MCLHGSGKLRRLEVWGRHVTSGRWVMKASADIVWCRQTQAAQKMRVTLLGKGVADRGIWCRGAL